jgi:hypothetical protein
MGDRNRGYSGKILENRIKASRKGHSFIALPVQLSGLVIGGFNSFRIGYGFFQGGQVDPAETVTCQLMGFAFNYAGYHLGPVEGSKLRRRLVPTVAYALVQAGAVTAGALTGFASR